MVDFTESMLGIASPSVGAATVPSTGFTTMVKLVRGASGLSAQAAPVDTTSPAARVNADAPAIAVMKRAELMEPLPVNGCHIGTVLAAAVKHPEGETCCRQVADR